MIYGVNASILGSHESFILRDIILRYWKMSVRVGLD